MQVIHILSVCPTACGTTAVTSVRSGGSPARRTLRLALARGRRTYGATPAGGCRLASRATTLARSNSLAGRGPAGARWAVCARPSAELAPIRLGHLDGVMLGSLLDVRKRKVSLGVGNPAHLIETSEGIAYVGGVRQRLFPLVRERVDARRQITPFRQVPMLLMRLPCGLHAIRHCMVRSSPV